MKHNILIFAILFLCLACQPAVRIAEEADVLPEMFPDYSDVTVPVNIAPLNFRYDGDASRSALVLEAGGQSLTVRGPEFDIPLKAWHELTASGDITARVCVKSSRQRW